MIAVCLQRRSGVVPAGIGGAAAAVLLLASRAAARDDVDAVQPA